MTRREKEVTDINTIMEILNKCKVMHIALVDEGMPYVVPMNYGYEMNDGKLTLYMHGSTYSHKLDIIRVNPDCAFEMNCDVQHFEGDVACRYGTSYYSLSGHGKAYVIDNPEDKMEYLSKFMKSQVGMDVEFNEKLVSVVSIMRIDVTDYMAKFRPMPKK